MFKYIKSTWLCIKYPFLYPRNRYTGLHYNNWTIINYQTKLYQKYHRFYFKQPSPKHERKYFRTVTEATDSYWTSLYGCIWYYIVDFWHDNVLQWFHCLTDYTELDALPETWKNDFGMDWVKAVKKYLKSHNIKHYRIAQLKEKWGEFDWLYPPRFDQECNDLEQYFINRSISICYKCGRPATKVTPVEGYKLYYCDKCAPHYAESIYKKTLYLTKEQVNSLKEELQNIDSEISLSSDNNNITLQTNNSEINL